MIDKIKDQLESFIDHHPEYELQKVFYGRAYDPNDDLMFWNYIVASRLATTIDSTKSNDTYMIIVAHENYIPKGCVLNLVDHLEKNIPGLRIAPRSAEYDYTFKGNSQLVVEGVGLEFSAPSKRCCR